MSLTCAFSASIAAWLLTTNASVSAMAGMFSTGIFPFDSRIAKSASGLTAAFAEEWNETTDECQSSDAGSALIPADSGTRSVLPTADSAVCADASAWLAYWLAAMT
ncbi:hypothetical protein C1N64_08165 [Pantoea sp. SGAir0215]